MSRPSDGHQHCRAVPVARIAVERALGAGLLLAAPDRRCWPRRRTGRSWRASRRRCAPAGPRATKLSAKATALAQEVAELQDQLVARAAAAQEPEAALDQLEAQLADLEKQQAAKSAELAGRRQAAGPTPGRPRAPGADAAGRGRSSPTARSIWPRGELLLQQAVPSCSAAAGGWRPSSPRSGAFEEIAPAQQIRGFGRESDATGEDHGCFAQKASLQKPTAAQAAAARPAAQSWPPRPSDLQELIDRLARSARPPGGGRQTPQQPPPPSAATPEPATLPRPAGRACRRRPRRSPAHRRPARSARRHLLPWSPAPSRIRALPGGPGSLIRPVRGP